jgi:hypothetical protein
VHRSLGEQHQDGRTDIAATTAPVVPAAASTALARPETGPKAGSEAAGTEAPTEASAEAGSEAWPKWASSARTGVVPADVVAKLAAGLPALLAQSVSFMQAEAEVRGPRPAGESAVYMGKWVVHGCDLVSGKVTPCALPIR